jgi:protein phosphatase
MLWARSHVALAVVADGMGGAVAGEEASRIAVETLYDYVVSSDVQRVIDGEQIPAEEIADRLKTVIEKANAAIVQLAHEQPQLRGMGTTVTSVFVQGTQAVIGHVGDSRAYLVQAASGRMIQITVDHSFVEAMVAAGHISRADAEHHPMKNILYRALGQSFDLDVDLYQIEMAIGDQLILCSDGLTLHLRPDEIARIAKSETSPDNIARKLVELTNERGGKDNVSVIVIAVHAQEDGDAKTSFTQIGTTSSAEDDPRRSQASPFAASESRPPQAPDTPENR